MGEFTGSSDLNFEKLTVPGLTIGLIPAVVQDVEKQDVLMVGFMNPEAVDATIASESVTFWSRSKGGLWTKGESSGNRLRVVKMMSDCDSDTVLIQAEAQGRGNVCHRETRSCFD